MKNREVEINVSVSLPWAQEEFYYRYDFDGRVAREALVPLPKSRVYDNAAMFEAHRHQRRRQELVDSVARMIAAALMNACESQDK